MFQAYTASSTEVSVWREGAAAWENGPVWEDGGPGMEFGCWAWGA